MSKKLKHHNAGTATRLAWKDNPTLDRVLSNMLDMGMTDHEIAKVLGVSTESLRHKKTYDPDIREKLTKGRSVATQRVVNAAFRAAVGGEEIITTIKKTTPKGPINITTRTLSRPDPKMIEFWLVNQDRDNWRRAQEIYKTYKLEIGNALPESDKIAELYQLVSKEDSDGLRGKHQVPDETARCAGTKQVSSRDVSGDVPAKTPDSLQDDVLDVPTEEGAVTP